jgi:hypothetical protein
LVFAALAVRSPKGTVVLNADRIVFHSFFYDLREELGVYFPALGKLRFITHGAFPFSPMLDETVSDVVILSCGSHQWSAEKLRLKSSEGDQELVDLCIHELGGLGWERLEQLLSEFGRITLPNE